MNTVRDLRLIYNSKKNVTSEEINKIREHTRSVVRSGSKNQWENGSCSWFCLVSLCSSPPKHCEKNQKPEDWRLKTEDSLPPPPLPVTLKNSLANEKRRKIGKTDEEETESD